ncbi:MAG: ATP-dependent 6-phosphofructokinase [Kiritimatiellia bacterium]|jgi:6-phosphofructokinase 1|nr:ATP-dependent 6-phosphofructokinase [Kiritimatiellia bacterium]MDP6809644.1 ATP-dependent 6-phosphofructokinase [Kiritimatiellia bacterium]MDP7023506.1 ATP-dependent 6-phosphofructokinase [Kiritimatiellia bacterium]
MRRDGGGGNRDSRGVEERHGHEPGGPIDGDDMRPLIEMHSSDKQDGCHSLRGQTTCFWLRAFLLNEAIVDHIHYAGGTILGSSRGGQPTDVIVDALEARGINVLLCVGGDGTQRGTHDIATEALRRGLKIAVVGVPKTIDNDIQFVARSFGYSTAIDKARDILTCAHNEAKGAFNGVGLVKLMGRDSGFIACGATLASQEANFCLIPEIPFALQGERGLLAALEARIRRRGHALIVVAEGAGQDFMKDEETGVDASGNKLHADIGLFLQAQIKAHFKTAGLDLNMKYLDPSYYVRGVAANSDDSLLCDQFARHAVHAAMAGKTDMVVGHWNDSFINLPTALATGSRRKVEPEGELWKSVMAATGQPVRML